MAEISREDLYAKVWSRPMIKVAADFGVSGTGLKKICERYEIPTPERGYWAKLQYGKRVRQEPLPAHTNGGGSNVRLPDLAELPEAVQQAKANALEKLAARAEVEPASAAPLDGSPAAPILHPALVATRRAIAKARTDEAGFVTVKGRGLVSLRIAPASVEYALAALGHLFQLADAIGHAPKVTDIGIDLIVDGEPVRFELEERAKDILHEPTPKELKQKARTTWTTRDPWRKYDQVPSGRLSVLVGEQIYQGPRRRYSESRPTTLADLAPQILAAFAEHAAFQKDSRAKQEERRRLWAEQEARRHREEGFATREKRRMAFIDAIGDRLAERSRLTAVLTHLESVADDAEAWRLANIGTFVRRRLEWVQGLLSPFCLGISANMSEVDFDEERATAKPDADSPWRYYAKDIKLQFWSIDLEKELAHPRSALEWAIEAGYAPGLPDDRATADSP